jgi:mono/diheme cytochrome c family protein
MREGSVTMRGAESEELEMHGLDGMDIRENRRIAWAYERSAVYAVVVIPLLLLGTLAGCDVERRRSDAELGLNPQQAAGRKIYDSYCDRCHRPYSTKGRKGPGLKGVFQHPYLPVSGLPANDDRMSEIIRYGRHEMPGYSQTLSAEDLQDLLAYLHTL